MIYFAAHITWFLSSLLRITFHHEVKEKRLRRKNTEKACQCFKVFWLCLARSSLFIWNVLGVLVFKKKDTEHTHNVHRSFREANIFLPQRDKQVNNLVCYPSIQSQSMHLGCLYSKMSKTAAVRKIYSIKYLFRNNILKYMALRKTSKALNRHPSYVSWTTGIWQWCFKLEEH